MALRQPPQQQQKRPVQRPASIPQSLSAHDPVTNGRVDESQEWILFSPEHEDESPFTSRTSQTPRTHYFGGLSDFGSLQTGIRSDQHQDNVDDGEATCQGTDIDDEEELDSLDDGLHAFHQPYSLDQSGGAILPAHDGLGSFHALYHNDSVQEHLWQFERYNPDRRRIQRRRSSVQRRLDALDDHAMDRQEERRLRIEEWRQEQSRAVLDEIEKETRRRRRRVAVMSRAASVSKVESDTENESFWERITRRVIKDLMGLDDTILSVIFGEELVSGVEATPTQQSPISEALTSQQSYTWENRLLNRIARELNILAHQLADHDRAFSTYTSYQPADVPSKPSQPRHIASTAQPLSRSVDATSSSAAPLFAPTFANLPLSSVHDADLSLWGIQGEPRTTATEPQPATPTQDQEKEYWERDLDVGVVFRYLRSRFSSRPQSPSPEPQQDQQQQQQPQSQSILPADWASPSGAAANSTASALGTSPESRRRADLIRRHHPLVSHAASVSATRRRESMLLRIPLHQILHRRTTSSSCASQSTKRTRSGGSRRYWDFPSGGTGSTAGGGSLVSVGSSGAGVMGAWGEV